MIDLVLGGLLGLPPLWLSRENATLLDFVLSDLAVETDVVGPLRTRNKRFVCATSLSTTCRWNVNQVRQQFSDPVCTAGPWGSEAGIGGKPRSFKDGCLHANTEFCLYGGVAIFPRDLDKVFERYSLADLWCRSQQASGFILFGAICDQLKSLRVANHVISFVGPFPSLQAGNTCLIQGTGVDICGLSPEDRLRAGRNFVLPWNAFCSAWQW